MKKTLVYIILTSATCFFGLVNTFAQQGTILGRIRGKESLLAGATVTMGNTTVISGKDGEFSLSIDSGTYTLTISHTGYQKIKEKIVVAGNSRESFEFTMIPNDELGEIVVIGSRSSARRSNLETPVPIDLISSAQLKQTGQTSLTQMLNRSAPSVNATRQTLNEPITLRGLYPDQVLILLNGIRLHDMAWLHDGSVSAVLGKGTVSNDLNAIPFSAIDKIEILRDGASAQYGSDAIAGVVNIALKSNQGTSVDFHSGQYYKGDGQDIQFGISHGVSLNKSSSSRKQDQGGFLELCYDFNLRNPTSRGGIYTGTVYANNPAIDDSIVKARGFDRSGVSNAGNAQLTSMGSVVNGAYKLKRNLEIFWTGLFNDRMSVFEGAYRFPKNTRLVNVALFPDGFKGNAKSIVKSYTAIAGLKGKTMKGGNWNYTAAYGNNSEDYYGENTNNASQYLLGKDAPTSFYTSTLIYQQLIQAINIDKELSRKPKNIKSVNLGLGVEWRLENFQMKPGEDAAWQDYDPSGRKDGRSQSGLVVAPEDAVNKSREVIGSYIDLETEINDRLLVALAGRYEYYNDFGGNIAGKLAARYKWGDILTLRASINTGYRAPSIQQRYYGNITKGVDAQGTIVRRGIFNNDDEVVKLFGIPPLEPERSINFGAGITSSFFHHMYLTVDAYWIQIRDRIVLSGTFDRRMNSEVDSLLVNYPDIDQVAFFTNAINTRTRGIDVVINSHWNVHKGHLSIMLATNLNHTKLFGGIKTAPNLRKDDQQTNTLFNRQEVARVEEGQPDSKIILLLDYNYGKFAVQLRNTRFGNTKFVFIPDSANYDEFFSAKILTDLVISFHVKKEITLSLGADNLFDVYPDRIKNQVNTADGRNIYAMEAQPFGFNGGHYFIGLNCIF